MKYIKRFYRKLLIWLAGPFKTRITRCDHCTFMVFNKDCDAYAKMTRHKLYSHCTTISEQMLLLEKELENTKDKLLSSLAKNNWG